MPIVVDEVVISIEVGEGAAAQEPAATPSGDEAQTLVRECVERVLEILEQRNER
jgi:hypothetical protein